MEKKNITHEEIDEAMTRFLAKGGQIEVLAEQSQESVIKELQALLFCEYSDPVVQPMDLKIFA
jgi:hypothetical protein